ncbi:hypothetical protein CNMCM5623_002124 [Aspergillus felis]|uniref:Ribosomal RNA methyltransferase FtsJ domain-containing protein n=1 Tax=Aspergillus felis TaxID=1287682 RepID=A0A8H6QA86_9EURO|nr:hypothetical protein CNMCM5623_002124 [Aspergillus felis]
MSTFEDTQLWTDYILSNPLYKELSQLKEEGWSNPAGDLYFETRRQTAAKPSRRVRGRFYKMTQGIGDALASATGIYHLDCSHPTILDLCMAPGGFSSTSKNHLPNSVIDAVTLHPDEGGYQVMAKGIFRDIVYADITMFAQEMAPGSAIPAGHPDLTKFESPRPRIRPLTGLAVVPKLSPRLDRLQLPAGTSPPPVHFASHADPATVSARHRLALYGVAFWAAVAQTLVLAVQSWPSQNSNNSDSSREFAREGGYESIRSSTDSEDAQGESSDLADSINEGHEKAIMTLGFGIMTSLLNASTAVVPILLAETEGMAGFDGLERVFLVLAVLGYLASVRLAWIWKIS